jgi:hypothetical protein
LASQDGKAAVQVNPRTLAGFNVMSISRQLDRRPTTDMKWLVHDLLKGEHNDIPPQRSLGQLTGAAIDVRAYSFEPTPVHIVSYRRTGETLGLEPSTIRQEAFRQA